MDLVSNQSEHITPPSPPTTPTTIESNLWDIHDRTIAEINARATRPSTNNRANGIVCVREYLQLPFVIRKEDPLNWWKSKLDHSLFKHFVPLVKRFLCIPGTSVPSEQLFSAAGELISPKRSRLTGTMVEMLLFLNKN